MKISLSRKGGFTRTGREMHPSYLSLHERYCVHYCMIDAMCTEHNWLIAGSASNTSTFDQISENFVEIYIKILNYGKVLNYYIKQIVHISIVKNFFRLVGGCIPASPLLDPPLHVVLQFTICKTNIVCYIIHCKRL